MRALLLLSFLLLPCAGPALAQKTTEAAAPPAAGTQSTPQSGSQPDAPPGTASGDCACGSAVRSGGPR